MNECLFVFVLPFTREDKMQAGHSLGSAILTPFDPIHPFKNSPKKDFTLENFELLRQQS